jgi:adenosylmethionine-8-amino-7-oxononanoate aminotransferase
MKPGTDESNIEYDREHIWHPFTSFADAMRPIHIASASGVYLYTADGRKIIDAISSWWVNLHGHSNPLIASAIYEQANTLEHVIFAGFTHDPAITLARNLLSVLPANQKKVFFSDNGSTAVEVAIKMSLQYFYNLGKPRRKIIAFEGSYHGDTFGSMSVGSRSAFTAPFESHLFKVEFINVPDEANFDNVLQSFQNIAAGSDVASFIYEPLVQGAGGMRMYDAKYLQRLVEEARKYEIICIADEVFTGFGRTGKWFASEYLDAQPDIMAVSKGITGGTLPLGVTTCNDRIAEPFRSSNPAHTFFHGHSYTANPISCAAANASFQLMQRVETWDNIRMISKLHVDFRNRIRSNKHVKDARALGTILAIELNTASDTSYFNSIRKKIYSFFLERDILLRPLGNVIYILPPYIITEKELKVVYDAIEDFLDTLG